MIRTSIVCVAALLFACKTKTSDDLVIGTSASSLTSPTTAMDLDPSADVVRIRLEAAPRTGSNSSPYLYAYNGVNPGPTIRAKIGDTLEVEFAAYLNETKSETNTNEDFIFNKTRQEDLGSFEDISEEMIKNED